MEFSEIASIAGKGGLYKVLKSSRSGVIVESIDDKQQRFLAGIHHRVSILSEISIYVTDGDGHVPLEDVMIKINKEFGEDPGIDGSADQAELRAFLKHLLPNYDEDRVYASDIKKLISWYGVIYENFPEMLKEKKSSGKKDASKEAAKKKSGESTKSSSPGSKPKNQSGKSSHKPQPNSKQTATKSSSKSTRTSGKSGAKTSK